MAEDLQMGGLQIPVTADLERLSRQMEEVAREAPRMGDKIGAGIREGIERQTRRGSAAGNLTQSLEKEGRGGGKALADGVSAGLRDSRGRFTKAGGDAGREAGNALGDGVEEGAKKGLGERGLLGWLKATFALQATQLLYRIASGFTGALRESVGAAEEKIQSYTRMSSAAKLFGVSEAALIKSSQDAKREYNLTSSAANELAIQTTKIAARAGDASQASTLLARTLDLAAANGGDAARAGEALEQTLRGQDEGTDFLLQKNPSQIYTEWAKANGKAAATLTDVEQKQALVNAILTSGAKVQGAYRKQIDGQLGPLTRWRTLQRTVSENLGTGLIPLIGKLADVMSGPLLTATNGFVRFLDRIDRMTSSPLENLIKDLKEAGAHTEKVLRLETLLQIKELERKDRAYRTNPNRRDVVSVTGGLSADDARAIERATGLAPGRAMSDAQVSTDVNAQIERVITSGYDVTKVGYTHLLALHKQALTELESLGERVSNGWLDPDEAEARAKALTDYAAGLQAVIDRRKAADDTLRELQTTRGAYADLLAGKKPAEAPGPSAPPPTTPALTDSERKQLEQQAKSAGEQMQKMLADVTASALDDQLLALKQFEDAARETYRKLGKAFPKELADGLARLRENAEQMGQVEARTRELTGLRDLGATPEHLHQIAQYLSAITAERDQLAEGSAAREKYNDLIRETSDLYARGAQAVAKSADAEREAYEKRIEAAVKAEEEAQRAAEERRRQLQDTARGIEENARAALQLAEAFGIVDEKTSEALESLAQVGASIVRIAGGDLSAIPSLIGGVAQIVSSLFGGGNDEEALRARAEQLDAMHSLVQALKDLKGAVLTQISVQEKEKVVDAGEGFLSRHTPGGYHRNPDGSVTVVNDTLDLNSLSPADYEFLRRLEELTGQSGIFDETTGKVDWQLFKAAWDSFQKADVGSFADDLTGRLDALDYAFSTAGDAIGSAADRMDMFVDAVREFAPEFADEFQRILSEQGAEAAKAWLQQQALLFAQPGGAGNLGLWAKGLTSAEIQRIISEGMERVGDLSGGVVGGGQTEMRLGVSMTEVQGSQLLALESTQTYYLGQIVALLSGGRMPSFPSITPPSPQSLGLTSGSGGATTIDLRGASFPLSLPAGTPPPRDADGWQRIGEGFGRGLAQQLQDVAQGAGLDRPRLSVRR